MAKRKELDHITDPVLEASFTNVTRRSKRRRGKGKNKHHHDNFAKLKALPNFQVVHKQICNGVSCENVASFIQNQCHLYMDVKYDSVVRMLYRYRDQVPFHARTPRQISKLEEILKEETHRIDELRETNLLYEYSKYRISKLATIDADNKFGVHPQLGAEIDRAARLLLQIRAMHKDLGVGMANGVPSVVNEDVDALDQMRNSAVAVVVSQYGMDAETVLMNFGRKLRENLAAVEHEKRMEIKADMKMLPAETGSAPSPS